jgi:hypothetical protein
MQIVLMLPVGREIPNARRASAEAHRLLGPALWFEADFILLQGEDEAQRTTVWEVRKEIDPLSLITRMARAPSMFTLVDLEDDANGHDVRGDLAVKVKGLRDLWVQRKKDLENRRPDRPGGGG